MTGIILAGGKNSRMGMKKAFINVRGINIIDNTLAILDKIFQEIIIVTNTPEDFEYTGVKTVNDLIEGIGPIGGIYTGLMAAQYEQCFVTACDMPFINSRLIKYMIEIIGYDIVVPMVRGLYEPLFACYSKKCADYAIKQIRDGNFKVSSIYSQARVKAIEEDELQRFDAGLISLMNINTKEELYYLNLNMHGK